MISSIEVASFVRISNNSIGWQTLSVICELTSMAWHFSDTKSSLIMHVYAQRFADGCPGTFARHGFFLVDRKSPFVTPIMMFTLLFSGANMIMLDDGS